MTATAIRPRIGRGSYNNQPIGGAVVWTSPSGDVVCHLARRGRPLSADEIASMRAAEVETSKSHAGYVVSVQGQTEHPPVLRLGERSAVLDRVLLEPFEQQISSDIGLLVGNPMRAVQNL